MNQRDIARLVDQYGIISDQVDRSELSALLYELAKTLDANRDATIVEFGCYIGTTSLYIRRLMDSYKGSGEFHVYDSFEGLPEKTSHDRSALGEQFKAGELAVGKKAFMREFHKASLRPPVVHKAWFNELAAADIPQDIQFAFLDGDYYESIMQSFRLIEKNLASNAVIVVDDYGNEALPGASAAVDEWCRVYGCKPRVIASLAIIRTR